MAPAARPVSTSRNTSAVSLAGITWMSSLSRTLIRVATRWVSPPACAEMALPRKDAMSSTSTGVSFLATSTTCATKVVGANETSLCRSGRLLAVPHSRSIVPLLISGIRVADITGTWRTSSLFMPRTALSFCATCSHISRE